MERLTKYDENAKYYLPFSLTDWSEIKIMNKLGELEDVLEKFEIENPDILALNLQTIKNINIHNTNLQNELAELKRKAIVPKYRQGQLVYILYNNIPSQVSIDKIIIKAKIESKFSQFNKIEIKYKVDYDSKHYNENDIFATQKEAEQKLAEIKGEK